MKNSKKAFFSSIVVLMLCITMFIGATFAWFTDFVASYKNIIKAGNLDVEMYWTDDLDSGTWYNVEDDAHNTIFNYDKWEPGYTEVRYIKIVNAGSLAFNYQLALTPMGEVGKLAEVINVFYANDGVKVEDREDLSNMNSIGLLKNVMDGGATAKGTLLTKKQQSPLHKSGEEIITIAMNMITTAGNEYQNESVGDGFTITALATQCPYEEDSFGNDYDSNAKYPAIIAPGKVSVAVSPENGVIPAGGVTLSGEGLSATVPAGVAVVDGTDRMTLTVKPLEHTTTDITTVNNEILIPVDVHVSGVADNNTVPIIINLGEIMPQYLNMGNYTLFHVEDGVNNAMTYIEWDEELTAHNQFKYDPLTGEVVVAMASFSEVAVLADTDNAWNGTVATAFAGGKGTEADPYVIANADQLAYMGDRVSNDNADYGSAHYQLAADVNIGNRDNYSENGVVFYPIGYNKVGGEIATAALDDSLDEIYFEPISYSAPGNKDGDVAMTMANNSWYTYGGSFKGVFDGMGHKVSGIYQNTWAMKGNYAGNYYNAAMGLFGYVNGGTVKNLTIDSFYSEGEFAPTGCVTAYAGGSATFENIAITNSHPQTYNTGVAGIVGWDNGNSSNFTFKNITVDDTNTMSALWGSWDVAASGILGCLKNGSKANFENCNVAATIDVYNDVCGNYQYYWYRYSGAFIGTVYKRLDNGKGALDLSDVTATNCTVNFGDRHEYYYCEFVENTKASYTHDYQFSRVDNADIVGSGDSATCQNHNHEEHGYETINGNSVLVEDKQAVYIPYRQLFGGYGWGVDGVDLGEYANIHISDITNAQEKFVSKFSGDFTYRVGNSNAVSVEKLFAAKDGVTINNSGTYVTIDKVDENSNVSGKFTPNTSDWTKGTIQFSGTGVVKVTIQDYDFCKPTELTLEVVDAVNATTATSATKNNVVLLNDCGFSSLEVSGGYTLYGNGFTMTCGSDSAALDMGYGFVTLNNGTLDNVQVVCPNFDYAVLYKSNMTESGNRSETTDKTRYYNVKSGVMASGNSQILNSRISGGRAALNVSGGNVVVDNSRIELGAVASILVGSANTLTLRDVTLVQKPTASTSDSSKKLMGFSVLFVCDSNGDATPVTLEGTLVQYAWVDENDKQYVPSAGQSIVDTVMQQDDYLHDIDGNKSLNLGFAYMPESLTSKVNTTTITDNRTDKTTIPYDYAEVAILNGKTYVYSYKNTKGTADSYKEEPEYKPNKYSDIITVNYSDSAEGLTTGKSYGTDGWIYELNVDLDKANGYALDFSKLSMNVNGVTVTDYEVNGSAKPATPVTVAAGGTTYTLTATISGKEYNANYKVTGTETSKESPSLVASNYEAGLCVASSYGGTWHGAAPALEGIQIKYWSVAEKQYKTINLSDYTPTTAGKQNGTNTTWTYSPGNGDFTLTLTGGQVHSSNNVYAMPVVCDGKLYFVAASSNGLVNSGNGARTIPVSYSFKDNNNGDTLTFSHTWSVAENKDAQYKYSDFCNGTLTKLESSSSGNCVTPDTLITLADGSKMRVDSLTGNEQLLVWNMETGSLDSASIMFVDNDLEATYEVIKLYFSDNTEVKVISEHGFWNYDLNKYVYLDKDAAKYIGHTFAKQNGEKLEKVTLVDVVLEEQVTTAWSPVTAGHLCYFVNDMLSMPGGVGGLFNIFEVDAETMTYDYEAMARDIETYGLFTYEELSQYAELSREMFDAAGGQYLKVSIEKGNLTEEELVAMIERYGKYFN